VQDVDFAGLKALTKACSRLRFLVVHGARSSVAKGLPENSPATPNRRYSFGTTIEADEAQ